MYKKITLPNGLRVIANPLPSSQTVTVLVLVAAGSKYETKKINGISHFLEHMTFKGTKKRPTPLDIAEPLDRIGGQYNAFTTQEYTGYYAKAGAKHFDLVFDIISDIFLNPKFVAREVAKEKGVIIEELNMYLDSPMRHIADLWQKLLYGDQPAGWNVGGEKEIIAAIQPRDLAQYHNNHYVSGKTVVVVSGNITPESVFRKAKALFRGISREKGLDKSPVTDFQERPASLVEYKKTDQAHIILGVRGYNIFDSRRYTADVLATILGGGMSSRLFRLLRGKMGAAYYVFSESENLTDHGFLATYAGIDIKRAKDVIAGILKEYKSLTQKTVLPDELSKAKDHLIGSMTLSLESSDDWARFYGYQELIKREIRELTDIVRNVSQVTAGDVREVANDIFRSEKLGLALIGPFQDSGDFEKILSF